MYCNPNESLRGPSKHTFSMIRDFDQGANCKVTVKISAYSLDLEYVLEKQGVSRRVFLNEKTGDDAILSQLEKLLDEVDLELENRRYINDHIRQTDKCRS